MTTPKDLRHSTPTSVTILNGGISFGSSSREEKLSERKLHSPAELLLTAYCVKGVIELVWQQTAVINNCRLVVVVIVCKSGPTCSKNSACAFRASHVSKKAGVNEWH